jgi:hypothetical protein
MHILWRYTRCAPLALHFTCVWIVRSVSVGWTMKQVCCIAAKLAVIRVAEPSFWLLQYPSVLHVMLLFCDRFQSWMSSPGEPPPHFFVSSFPLMSYTAYKWAEKLFFFVSRFIYWNAEQPLSFKTYLTEVCTNPGRQVPVATYFSTVASNIVGS